MTYLLNNKENQKVVRQSFTLVEKSSFSLNMQAVAVVIVMKARYLQPVKFISNNINASANID
jgi:hypothetical protein